MFIITFFKVVEISFLFCFLIFNGNVDKGNRNRGKWREKEKLIQVGVSRKITVGELVLVDRAGKAWFVYWKILPECDNRITEYAKFT